ncbi:MAG: hypothetical protein M4D80_29110 [Myxococcota bacterium]|nr:hypothetical protein [Myxococcota bacterium]
MPAGFAKIAEARARAIAQHLEDGARAIAKLDALRAEAAAWALAPQTSDLLVRAALG